ncbi:hypothetical protein M378DRAFT_11124 [Amanita muscaria Koide BX008]|uniref:Uncharacterized protein n=1 Tax=Amanita muscaria (strain Koide BX008) TaxID=946122 RepID=A0A0C2X6X6_AMAMK|nr:hypothetical protein M378DRAFT_11124 [Amanita muscaria Koide BX008]
MFSEGVSQQVYHREEGLFAKAVSFVMTSPLDELKKDLEVLRNRIETWETTLEEDLKANKRVTERDEEWFVDGECAPALAECLEDPSDCDKETSGSVIICTKGPEPSIKDTLQQAAVVKKNATYKSNALKFSTGRNQSL